ncbi:hypothetical protein WJX73_007079 [Symbiochloris irregularis]|uniref:Pyruvate phosphate dikinase AMP/ATP-binding domain-containing protein n=1 Tax=Symbiochloris irregularis TaxID=706552 RepID=A0AAW1PLG7_9CHLO
MLLSRTKPTIISPLASLPVQHCRRQLQPRVLRAQSLASFPSKRSPGTVLSAGERRLSTWSIAAVAAPPALQAPIYAKEYPLRGGSSVSFEVQETEQGDQVITLRTSVPGKLVLHWGVEGGDFSHKSGWVLPPDSCRPEGTVQYKKRALQTPFKNLGEDQELTLRFPSSDTFDYLNFVIKETATNSWYDALGSNFHVPLRLALSSMAEMTVDDEVFIPEGQLPDVPQELCGIWSYIQWEAAGCPNRSQGDSDAAYQDAIQDLKNHLRKGTDLSELWKVARGEVKYADFVGQKGKAQTNGSGPAAPPRETPRLPEELVGLQAYLLWEKAGKPDGADFSNDARQALERQLASGSSVQDLEKALHAPAAEPAKPPPPQEQEQEKEQDKEAPQAQEERPPPPPPKQEQAQLGQSTDVSARDPLSFIKSSAPLLSADKKQAPARPLGPLEDAAGRDDTCVWQRTFGMGDKSELLATVRQSEGKKGPLSLDLVTDAAAPLVLHWGVRKGGRGDWSKPSEKLWPSDSTKATDTAIDSPFQTGSGEDFYAEASGDRVPLQRLHLQVPGDHSLAGITFVLRSKDNSRWWRDGGSNFLIPLPGAPGAKADNAAGAFEDDLSRTIVDCEVNSGAWTLMHRYNKAADLLSETLSRGDGEGLTDAMARIYVWLRYSAARQLTWQKNYNTQPRILGEAQRRLTEQIAQAHGKTGGEAQEWVRSMLGTVGRGGNAQAVRDEILHIMHRNHIGEKRGTWMEDWHQKLHNNTTPDDIAICEAYIAFLEGGGDNGAYWRVLSDAGVTRERLESFDRAIKVEPEDYPDKRGALINDFRSYLGILKSVHSGADLNASAQAAGDKLPGGVKGYLGYVQSHQGDHIILPLIENAVEARTELAPALSGNRDLLYLDLALENVVRAAAERGTGAAGGGAGAMIGPLLQNLVLSTGDNEELCYCLKAWSDLPKDVCFGQYPTKEHALKAAAVIDRIRRAIATVSDRVSGRIDPIATSFGKAFGVEDWYVELFAEEVVRGGPAFALSLVLSAVEPTLRAAAELGAWQLISPVNAVGRVVVAAGLHEVQDNVYEEPTVLLAKRVTGEEEVPEGAVAVLTPDAPDVLSHVSVRARNMKVLFAICHDEGPLKEIEALAGKAISLQTSSAGGVTWETVDEAQLSPAATNGSNGSGPKQPKKKALKVKVPQWCGKWAVGMNDYKDGIVGAKSKNIAGLRGKLPDSIGLPPSVTVPFGAFEEALGASENKQVKQRLEEAIAAIPETHAEEALKRCHSIAMEVQTPPKLQQELAAAMKEAGIPVPDSEDRWQQALTALKGVWASKYNERAMLSMRKVGLDFRDLRMAVLVQRVVPAAYAYVIHTENPTNNSPDEVFAEVVMGLGESIVSGLVPGAALSFKAPKTALDKPQVMAFPSKGEGMYVPESLIFRSDSNGEDLEGYAGAGLYDSITMDSTETRKVDYGADRLLTDEGFRNELLAKIAKVGAAVEDALGSAQDIEGCVEEDGSVTVVQTRPQH